MHIHLPWLLLTVVIIVCIILLIAIPTEQQRLIRTDLRKQFRDKNKLK